MRVMSTLKPEIAARSSRVQPSSATICSFLRVRQVKFQKKLGRYDGTAFRTASLRLTRVRRDEIQLDALMKIVLQNDKQRRCGNVGIH